jgi:hypothetical protein
MKSASLLKLQLDHLARMGQTPLLPTSCQPLSILLRLHFTVLDRTEVTLANLSALGCPVAWMYLQKAMAFISYKETPQLPFEDFAADNVSKRIFKTRTRKTHTTPGIQ